MKLIKVKKSKQMLVIKKGPKNKDNKKEERKS